MTLHFPLVLDGATGTQLQARGYDGSACAEEWILGHPDALIELQQSYVEAGSDIVYAPTFGANRIKLEEHQIFGKVEEYNLRLVELSRKAAGGKALVAGDIAPTGKMLYPMGDASFEDIFDVYLEQAAALEKAGVDLFVVETMMNVSDARAAVMAIRSVSSKPVLVSFSADKAGRIISGSDIRAVCLIMEGLGADAFGLNCSSGPDDMLENLKKLASVTRLPLIAKPNAGLPDFVDGKSVYRCPPEEFTRFVPLFAENGTCLFGGCCGTTREHIAAIRAALPAETKPLYDADDSLRCCTERSVFKLPADTVPGEALQCTEDLEDDIADCEEDILTIAVASEEDVQLLAEAQYAINLPLCLVGDDVSLLEKAVRAYQGRCLVHSDADVNPLCAKYGCIRI